MTQTQRSGFRGVFRSPHTVLVVVHVTNSGQALRNSRIAQESGADGVFLINHGIGSYALREAWDHVVTSLPSFWVGVNDLARGFLDTAAAYPDWLPGVWEDHSVLADDGPDFAAARERARRRTDIGRTPLLFGGVAFKYGPDERLTGDRLADLAAASRTFVDVVTTSGPGTGQAADINKIATIRDAIGDYPLAIASGVTSTNVGDYLPLADCFLVASGISRSFDELDGVAVSALVARIRLG